MASSAVSGLCPSDLHNTVLQMQSWRTAEIRICLVWLGVTSANGDIVDYRGMKGTIHSIMQSKVQLSYSCTCPDSDEMGKIVRKHIIIYNTCSFVYKKKNPSQYMPGNQSWKIQRSHFKKSFCRSESHFRYYCQSRSVFMILKQRYVPPENSEAVSYQTAAFKCKLTTPKP